MRKVQKTRKKTGSGLSVFDILLAVISIIITANLIFGPVYVNLSNGKLKFFDNGLLFVIWLAAAFTRHSLEKKKKIFGPKSFFQRYGYETGLAVVLLLAAVPRFMSIGYGLPHLAEPHEQLIIPKVLSMIRNGTLNHGIYDYGSLHFIFLYFVFILTGFIIGVTGGKPVSIFELDDSVFILAARAANVILALISIYLVYLIGKRLAGKKTGLAAAAVTGAGTVLFLNSITARLELLVLVFVLLAFYYMLKLTETDKISDYCLAGLFCGAAVGTKFYSITIVVGLIYAHLLNKKRKTFSNRKLLISFLVMIAIYLITNPYIITHTDSFIRDTSRLSSELGIKEHWSSADSAPEAVYARIIFFDGIGIVGTVSFLILLLLFLFKPDSKSGFLLFFPVIHFLVLSGSRYVFHRYILIAIPFLVLFLVYRLENKIESVKKRINLDPKILFWAIIILILIPPVIKMCKITSQYNLPLTSESALKWIEANVPAGSRIMATPCTVYLDEKMYSVAQLGIKWKNIPPEAFMEPGTGCNYIITMNRAEKYGLKGKSDKYLEIVKFIEPEEGRTSGPTITIMKIHSIASFALKKSDRVFLGSGEKQAKVVIGDPESDTIHLGSDWGPAMGEPPSVYRYVRDYPAAFFFKISEDVRIKGRIFASIECSVPPEYLPALKSRYLNISLNDEKVCSIPFNINENKITYKCQLKVKNLKFGRKVNRLDLEVSEPSIQAEFKGQRIMSILPIKYHSIQFSSE